MTNPDPPDEKARLRPEELAAMIDHTVLKAATTAYDVDRLCAEAVEHRFASVCVNTAFAARARRALGASPVKVCTTVGFPLGAMAPAAKTAEARQALEDGAAEIDMVLFIGALKAGDATAVEDDIRGVVSACRGHGALCKVILETCYLSDGEKIHACEIGILAGADFVKTSTGFGSGGATAADVDLMCRVVRPHGLHVKASGGIRTLADAMSMIRAGATRLGTSSGVAIVRELKGEP